jgi:hypothetical protein
VAKKKPATEKTVIITRTVKKPVVEGYSNNAAGWLMYDGKFCYVFKDDELVPIKSVPAGKQVWYQPCSFGNIRTVPSTERKAA